MKVFINKRTRTVNGNPEGTLEAIFHVLKRAERFTIRYGVGAWGLAAEITRIDCPQATADSLLIMLDERIAHWQNGQRLRLKQEAPPP